MRAMMLLTAMVILTTQAQAEPDWNAVGQALGKPGMVQAGGVYRVSLPRSDLKVVLDGVELKPALALGSWLTFRAHGAGNEAAVMGDLVLTDDEVSPVMKRLVENSVEITALHNHVLRGSPNTMYMHIHGQGDATKLATILREALGASKTPFGGATAGTVQPVTTGSPGEKLDLDTAALDRTLGHTGKVNGGVYQFSIPRAEIPREHDMEIPEAMGSAIAINFQPTGGGKAAITGDFVLSADEVNPVVRALRVNGIDVTALHNHMLDDEPRLFFMHFWANDNAERLARGLKVALDKVKTATR
jgi:Domain of Unknown Function (DUF1259)